MFLLFSKQCVTYLTLLLSIHFATHGIITNSKRKQDCYLAKLKNVNKIIQGENMPWTYSFNFIVIAFVIVKIQTQI